MLDESTAGPSTSLCSGRDDNSYFARDASAQEKLTSRKKSQTLGMTKGRAMLPSEFGDTEEKTAVSSTSLPGFPGELGGFGKLQAPFFTEGRTRGLFSAWWQEIRVRFGSTARRGRRDDDSYFGRGAGAQEELHPKIKSQSRDDKGKGGAFIEYPLAGGENRRSPRHYPGFRLGWRPRDKSSSLIVVLERRDLEFHA
jgi:hypothetical protein